MAGKIAAAAPSAKILATMTTTTPAAEAADRFLQIRKTKLGLPSLSIFEARI
tara:strand:- start:73 stop:228 length:156 start_codon:yes stop_codon:yes gene_type:complete